MDPNALQRFLKEFDHSPGERRSRTLEIPPPLRIGREDPQHYIVDSDLRNSARTAVMLGNPILITGEPGAGKTQFANWLNWHLGYPNPVCVFDTKSTSMGRDLFYFFNTVARFHAAQVAKKESSDPTRDADYITYNALGEAILKTLPYEVVKARELLSADYPRWEQPSRSVVLIDGIDKAPRDFPNDILHEVARMHFRIAELKNMRIEADQTRPPVLVMTSNSEKTLPDPFLRRCAYHHIPFPESKLGQIVEARLTSFDKNMTKDSHLVTEAVQLFLKIRDLELDKKPAIAELLDWIQGLRALGAKPEESLKDNAAVLQGAISLIVKTKTDRARATRYVTSWIGTS